jgi:hypothetical protein
MSGAEPSGDATEDLPWTPAMLPATVPGDR